jgi:ferrous iron transport protein B
MPAVNTSSTAGAERKLKIALAGNPNSGKSTLFNALTGLHQSTGNFPGVTVDKKTGTCIFYSGGLDKKVEAEIIDLPGIYSLFPVSLDESVAVEVITNRSNPDYPDLIVVVVDASNLKRNLFLVSQIIDQKVPVILALNMIDLVEKAGTVIDTQKISDRLGIPVISISARENKGLGVLKKKFAEKIEAPGDYFLGVAPEKEGNRTQENIERYRKITVIMNECIYDRKQIPAEVMSRKLDRVLTHKFWGFVVFLAVLFLIFQSIFFLAAYPMDWIESGFVHLSGWSTAHLPAGEFSDLLVNGVLAGLSGVAVFVPQIAFLFLFIAILEDTGYMARVSFIMDKLMRKFGLNGKSVIPLISGVACAVPAIMSTRTIGNRKERLITLLITPLMSCSARLPVYTLLIALAIPAGKVLGFFNLQGLVLMSLYLIGFLAAISAAIVMRYMLKSKEKSYFIMELPIYRSPRWSSIGITIVDKVKVFLFDAGKVIIAISIILWFLSAHAPGNRFAEIDRDFNKADSISAEYDHSPDFKSLGARENFRAHKESEKLKASYAGILGRTIEPIIKPLGFDWKIGIALVTSFAAREVFVGTMATLYSAGDPDNTRSIREKMNNETDAETGAKVYSLATCLSLMIFYAFAMQCMSTMAVVYRETKNIKWPLVQFAYMGILAYVSSFIIFHVFK